MKKLLAILILTLASLTACKSPAPVVQYITQTDTITLTIRERIRDSIFYTRPDSAIFEALIKCDSLNRAYIEEVKSKPGKRTQIIYRFKTDTLRIQAQVDSAAIYMHWKEKDTTLHTNSIKEITQPAQQPTQQPIKDWVIIAGLIIFLVLIGAIKQLFK